MKWIFFLLLAANLGYFIWSMEQPAKSAIESNRASAPAAGLPPLLLLTEATERGLYPPAEAPRATDPAPGLAPDPTTDSEPAAAISPNQPPPEPQPQPQRDSTSDATPPVDVATGSDEVADEVVGAPGEPAAAATPVPVGPPPAQDDTPADGRHTPANDSDELGELGELGETVDEQTHDSGGITPAPTSLPAPEPPAQVEASQPAPVAPSAPEPPEPVPTLGAATDLAAESPLRNCYQMGPFVRASQVSQAGARARELGIGERLLRSNADRAQSHTLYLGPYEGTEGREFAQRELEAHGYTGVRLVRVDDLPALVIARFATREEAAEPLAKLQKLGYKPLLARDSKSQTRFYLTLEQTAPDPDSAPAIEQLRADFPNITLVTTDCTPPVTDPGMPDP